MAVAVGARASVRRKSYIVADGETVGIAPWTVSRMSGPMIASHLSAWSRIRRLLLSRILLAVVAIAPLAACQTRPSQLAQDDESAWYIGTKADKPFDIPLVDGMTDPFPDGP